MENQPNQLSLPTCSFCNKIYSSMSSLCHHNQKYHSKNIVKKIMKNVEDCQPKHSKCQLIVEECQIKKNNPPTCENCNKVFNCRSSKSKHKKTCKPKQLDTEILLIQEEQKKLKQEEINIKEEQKKLKQEEINLKEEQKLIKLKLRLEKMDKIDSLTLSWGNDKF